MNILKKQKNKVGSEFATLDVFDLKMGYILAQDLVDSSGVLLLSAGTAVNARVIELLKYYGKEYGIVRASLRRQHIVDEELLDTFSRHYIHAVDNVNSTFSDILGCGAINPKIVMELMQNVVSYCKVHHIVPLINCMNNMAHYTQAHCLNVSALLMVIGYAQGYDRKHIENLMLAGALHDIGKVHINEKTLMATGKLTDEQFTQIKRHTEYGYTILSSYADLCDDIRLAALQHHVKRNQMGYPLGIDYGELTECSKLVAVCDIFEALTAERPYKKRMCPFEAFREIYAEAMLKADIDSALLLIRSLQNDYEGSVVELTDGRIGTIVSVMNDTTVGTPVVQFYDSSDAVMLNQSSLLGIKKVLGVMRGRADALTAVPA